MAGTTVRTPLAMPMFMQNGVWLEDAFHGVTIPARNSKALDITNCDVTFFASWDDITSNAFVKADGTRDEGATRLLDRAGRRRRWHAREG